MTPAEVGEAMVGALGLRCTWWESFGEVTVDVPRERWVQAVTAARRTPALDCGFFDWLTGVDDLADGMSVYCHVWSVQQRHGLLLHTQVPADRLELDTVTGVYAGAAWHERETHEMFGLVFAGHPHLVPLLLPDGFEGHPLRKDFVLAARVAKVWPGAKEPGESGSGAPTRRRMRPPGVPEPDAWGPQATPAPEDGGA
jgi:NADH-quinone oxidoreductase subunit C